MGHLSSPGRVVVVMRVVVVVVERSIGVGHHMPQHPGPILHSHALAMRDSGTVVAEMERRKRVKHAYHDSS